jgi:hypothetical protein
MDSSAGTTGVGEGMTPVAITPSKATPRSTGSNSAKTMSLAGLASLNESVTQRPMMSSSELGMQGLTQDWEWMALSL